MVQSTQEEGVDLDIITDSQQTPIPTQPSTSKPQKKQSRRKQRKDIEVSQSSASTEPMTQKETNEEVLALETTKTTQALEIANLKSRVKNLEKKASKRTHKFKRLYKVGTTRRVESSNDANLGAQDASKYGRKIADLNADVEVTLGDETQEMDNDNLMFDTSVLEEQEIEFEKVVEEIIVSVVATTKSIP
ncbi:hypothetical protein Tco_1468805, partial [Tanacetum coccineum]